MTLVNDPPEGSVEMIVVVGKIGVTEDGSVVVIVEPGVCVTVPSTEVVTEGSSYVGGGRAELTADEESVDTIGGTIDGVLEGTPVTVVTSSPGYGSGSGGG